MGLPSLLSFLLIFMGLTFHLVFVSNILTLSILQYMGYISVIVQMSVVLYN